MTGPLRVNITKPRKRSYVVSFAKQSSGAVLSNAKLLDAYVENGGELFISSLSYEGSFLKNEYSREMIREKLAKRVFNTKSMDFPIEATEILDNIYFT